MKIFVLGAGGVGTSVTAIASERDFFSQLVIGDIDQARAQHAISGRDSRFSAIAIDASNKDEIVKSINEINPDVVLNACDPRFNPPIFDACDETKTTYMDMAAHLSTAHPSDPFNKVGTTLGQYQFEQSERFEKEGHLAIVGMGVEPGLSDVFARYGVEKYCEMVDEIAVRDGANLVIEGYDFAPTFSIWTTIEECLNPPVIWEKDKGYFTTEPFSEPEMFFFPEGIGEVECVNVEHEEVLFIPRYLDTKRATFKYGLGDEFISVLKTLHMTGLDSKEPINVKGVSVAPRDVVAAALPDPLSLGDKMTGKTCAGTWIRGNAKDGSRVEKYFYHVMDNEYSMKRWGQQAVVTQTAMNPVMAMELLASGTWSGVGVHAPEFFDPQPFLDLFPSYDLEWGEMDVKV